MRLNEPLVIQFVENELKSYLLVQRKGKLIYLGNKICMIIEEEGFLQNILRNLPFALPNGDGTWLYKPNCQIESMRDIDLGKFTYEIGMGHPLEDTRLMLDVNLPTVSREDTDIVRLYVCRKYIGNLLNYIGVSMAYWPLFKNCYAAASDTPRGFVRFYFDNTLVGLVCAMVVKDSLPPQLKMPHE